MGDENRQRLQQGKAPIKQWPNLQALEGLTVERHAAWGKWLDEYRSQIRSEGRSDEERRREQDSVNPCYVPRNQVMQEVIKDAEAGNFEGVRVDTFPQCSPLLGKVLIT